MLLRHYYGLAMEFPTKAHTLLRAWSLMQQCPEMGIWGCIWIMSAVTSLMDESTEGFIVEWIIGRC